MSSKFSAGYMVARDAITEMENTEEAQSGERER